MARTSSTRAGRSASIGADGNRFKFDELVAADAQLLGRVTYDGFARAWPSMTDDEGFADRMNSMPKYVVSTTIGTPSWNNSTVIAENVAEEVRAVKDRYAGDLLVAGSGQLVRSMMQAQLVDELRLMVFPIVLGSGARLFAEGTPVTTLELVESRPVGPDGVTLVTYAPV